MSGRPTHNFCIKRRSTDQRQRYVQVGVGWHDPETGSMGISLSDGVVLDWRMKDTHTMVFFPRRDEFPDEPEDDIPF